jgi:hypothetical protein
VNDRSGVHVLRYLIGLYTILRGAVYLVEGVLLLTGVARYSLLGLVTASVLFVGALFFLFAGSGLAMGNFWALNLGAGVLVVDLLRMVGALALSPGPFTAAWFVGTLVALVLLVFKDPFGSREKPNLDEDDSVHGMTSFQN